MNEANMKAMHTQINMVKNELRNEMKNSIQASLSNQTNEIKNMMASLFQMNTASTLGSGSLPSNTVSGIVLDGPAVPTPPPFINPEEDERVEETLTDPDLTEYTIKVPPPPLHINITLADALNLMPKYQKMLKALLSNKEKLQELANTPLNENCSAPSGNPTFSSYPELTSSEVNIFDSEGGNVLSEKLLDLDSTKDLHPPIHVNPLSGSTTYSFSSNPLLEEFADEPALVTFPLKYDDDLQFDVEFDLKEIEFLLHRDIDSSLKDLIDQCNLADIFIDFMTEMFTDEHAPDYLSPSIFDEYDDDFLEVKSDAENVYDDPFDSKREKIKESKLLIDELDLPCDFPPSEYDSFISQDFFRVDAKPSTNNEDKVFNPGILSQEKPFEIITRVIQNKKLATSNASSMLEDCYPPFYEPLFFKEIPSIPEDLKTHAEGFCPPFFISSASLGNHVS
nr:reverse transcriptase domain-containing protein [Tanacetum cinerariifolium]